MAAPVINSIVPSKTVVAPGETFTVRINATDPDDRAWTLTGTATDSTGGSAQATVTFTVSDPLTYGLTAPAGAGFTIVQDGSDRSLFRVTAP